MPNNCNRKKSGGDGFEGTERTGYSYGDITRREEVPPTDVHASAVRTWEECAATVDNSAAGGDATARPTETTDVARWRATTRRQRQTPPRRRQQTKRLEPTGSSKLSPWRRTKEVEVAALEPKQLQGT